VTRNFCFDFCDYQWFEGRVICLRLNENLLVFFFLLKTIDTAALKKGIILLLNKNKINKIFLLSNFHH